MTSGSYDFAVIGGGVVGMSLAYGLRRQGLKVVVFDEGDTALRASRGNFALVWVQSKGMGMPDYARWTMRSIAAWRQLADSLEAVTGTDVGLDQRGGFLLYLSENEMQDKAGAFDRLGKQLGADRYPVEMMDREALGRMLPGIGADVVGGSYCALDGHVNALRLFGALHRACEVEGVDYRPNSPVETITPMDGGFAIRTGQGALTVPRVVLAAGLGNARLAPMVGLSAPVRPERGQIIVTEKLDHFLDYPIGNIRQTDEGSVLIGASKEDAGFDTRTSTPVLADLASDAVRMFPVLKRARVVRTWAALRVLSPDGCPVYDQSQSHPGAYLVTCHSGITLAAAHALDLAGNLAAGTWPDYLKTFSAQRFADVQKVA